MRRACPLFRMTNGVTWPNGHGQAWRWAVMACRPVEADQVDSQPSRCAGRARTASVSVRGQTRNTPGAHGRIADRPRYSH